MPYYVNGNSVHVDYFPVSHRVALKRGITNLRANGFYQLRPHRNYVAINVLLAWSRGAHM